LNSNEPNTVTKRELVIEVAEKLGYTQNEVSAVVQATLETITDTLAEGNRLEIRNFGVFEIKKRDARIGRNPRTGEAVPITEKRVAVFKPGKMLKELVEKPEPAPQPSEAPEPPAAPEAPPKPDLPAF
jgi:DNA-binding protein HU-beta/integration host factor subunit beta